MIKVVSNQNMRDSDAYTIKTKISSRDLMHKAGCEIYNSVNWISKVAIVCGFGNNAGDGYVLALLLNKSNIKCTLFLIEEKFSIDGLYYFDKCKEENIEYKLIDNQTNFNDYNMIVDAILGTGFKGKLSDKLNDAINLINGSNKEVISIDINSGLNGDNGLGDNCVKSNLTISIGDFKTGHFLNKAKDVINCKINKDIGIELIDNPYYLIEKEDLKEIFKERKNYSNKSTYSYVALIGGSINYSGAIRLATLANGALKSGAGVCTIATIKSLSPFIIPNTLEATFMPMDEIDGHIKFNQNQLDIIMNKYKVIAFGMGITNSPDTCLMLKYLLENYKYTLLIDADGLNALASISKNYLLNRKCDVILTPHNMEFSRLLSKPIEEININPVSEAIEYAKKFNLILLLKGPSTIITDGATTYIIDMGCPGMATAGSGDVLSGILSGIFGYNKDNLLLATAAGAYVNGLAGEIAQKEFGDISMTASDTVNNIYKAIMEIRK